MLMHLVATDIVWIRVRLALVNCNCKPYSYITISHQLCMYICCRSSVETAL